MGYLKGDTTGDDREINDAYVALRKRLIPQFTTEQISHTPKTVWKTLSVFQCLIRRTLEAADGMRSAWNQGNLLTATTMARSLIETGATIRHLMDSIKDATRQRDTAALDRSVMELGFAARYEGFAGDDWAHKAEKILTLIDSMDRSLFGDKKPRLRDAYDFLSEFAHPNYLGVLGLYSDNFPEEYRVEFGKRRKKKEMILPLLRVTLAMVLLAELAAVDLEALIPEITAFAPK